MADEFDRGERQLLNLGHTIGHAAESLSDFTLSHGKAVAIGTAVVARAAARQGICDQAVATRIQWLLQRFGLPVFTGESAADLARAAQSDKKRSGGTVNLIVPLTVGKCILRPTPVEELEIFIQAGL
jgi:3-dehydroquinate synthase